ncbi:anaerobic coproporphyrinogen III oxidase [Desulfitobacterium sp. LBE]|uniref:coproporphyrinogen III oxidase n=1 Tax=Desulfitobacterium sp. LBE TaxID=884086 RepID=UPI00119C0A30|nr:coproporphyrinogen III oxidase [Desulfitobacterium sp. LBE]TWH57152.1 anaerobic coproporphyrinogen III oxidase [Desulfitobacterium sp. LBE]
MSSVTVFVNIPFCIRRRRGESSHIRPAGKGTRNAYLEALEREIDHAGELLEGKTVQSIYVGGGAATVLSPDKLARLLLRFKRAYQMAEYLELTIAAAPETLVSPCLSGLNMCNFNRISVEALCASDKMLDYLGTSYRLADLEDGLTMLGMFNYRNVNADVMYGIPGQTKAALRNSLVTCLALPALSHITLRRFELSEQEGVSAEECRDQYRYSLEYLKGKGFCQYAAGHFAKKGYESRHFYYTSQGMDHIGFGVGAKSYVDGYGITNTTDLAKYLKWAGQYEEITENVLYLDEKARQKRFAALRLQLAEGFSEEEFAARFGEGAGAAMGPSLQLLLKQSFISCLDGRYVPTEEGLFHIDEIQKVIFAN